MNLKRSVVLSFILCECVFHYFPVCNDHCDRRTDRQTGNNKRRWSRGSGVSFDVTPHSTVTLFVNRYTLQSTHYFRRGDLVSQSDPGPFNYCPSVRPSVRPSVGPSVTVVITHGKVMEDTFTQKLKKNESTTHRFRFTLLNHYTSK